MAEVSFWGDMNVLKLTMLIGVQTVTILKATDLYILHR